MQRPREIVSDVRLDVTTDVQAGSSTRPPHPRLPFRLRVSLERVQLSTHKILTETEVAWDVLTNLYEVGMWRNSVIVLVALGIARDRHAE